MPKKDPFALEYKYITLPNGKRKRVPKGVDELVEKGIDTEAAKVRHQEDDIVSWYMQGKSLKECASLLGLSSANAIYHLKAKDERFSNKLDRARASRGFYFEEKVVETAEQTLGESTEEVAAARLKVDAFKWAAGVNNPDVHGNKTKILGATAPTVFIIDTGIRRDGDEPIEVRAEPASNSAILPAPEGDPT